MSLLNFMKKIIPPTSCIWLYIQKVTNFAYRTSVLEDAVAALIITN